MRRRITDHTRRDGADRRDAAAQEAGFHRGSTTGHRTGRERREYPGTARRRFDHTDLEDFYAQLDALTRRPHGNDGEGMAELRRIMFAVDAGLLVLAPGCARCRGTEDDHDTLEGATGVTCGTCGRVLMRAVLLDV